MAITKASSNAVAPAAKGDLVVGNATNDSGVLAVGSTNQVLTVDSSTATGLKWATASGASPSFSLLNAGGTALSGTSTSVTGISGQNQLLIIIETASISSAATAEIQLQLNSDTGSNYANYGLTVNTPATYNGSVVAATGSLTQTLIRIASTSSSASSIASGYALIQGCNGSGLKVFTASGGANNPSSTFENTGRVYGGFYNSSSTISSVQIKADGYTFDGGTVYIYGSAV